MFPYCSANIQTLSVFSKGKSRLFLYLINFKTMTAQEKIERLLMYLNINAKVFSENLGYPRPQIIYDIQKGKTKRISEELASKIVSVFPDISKSWLLADEGDMLKVQINQNVNGDNNTQVAGYGNNVNTSPAIYKAIDEIAEQRKLIAKSQEQIDRLLAIIEKMQNS